MPLSKEPIRPAASPRRREAAPRAITVVHDGETYSIQVKRVANARRFILRVRNATRDAVLTMPVRAALRDAEAFALSHAAWVGARLRRLPQHAPFAAGEIFPFRGRPTRIELTGLLRGGVRLEAGDDGGPVLRVAGEPAHCARRVGDFLKVECRRDLQAAVDRYAAMIEARAPRVCLRDTKSRWGSCSSAGALNFSWRLVMAPPVVLDYLAAHEVCHLRHMDHSDRFWSLCRRLCPATDEAEVWLRAHGAGLHRYGA